MKYQYNLSKDTKTYCETLLRNYPQYKARLKTSEDNSLYCQKMKSSVIAVERALASADPADRQIIQQMYWSREPEIETAAFLCRSSAYFRLNRILGDIACGMGLIETR